MTPSEVAIWVISGLGALVGGGAGIRRIVAWIAAREATREAEITERVRVAESALAEARARELAGLREGLLRVREERDRLRTELAEIHRTILEADSRPLGPPMTDSTENV